MKLQLAQREFFQGVRCDVWQDVKTRMPYMTIEQIANALGYRSRKGIENLLNRNSYVHGKVFSTTYKLRVVEGGRDVQRDMIMLTRDGIIEISFLSHKPVARKFRAWARRIIKAFLDGQLVWKEQRNTGKLIRKAMNDTINARNLSPHYYKIYSDLAYKTVFGCHAAKLREQRHVDKNATPLDFLTADELQQLNEIEVKLAGLISLGLEYGTIKAIMHNGGQIKIVPVESQKGVAL